MTQTTEVKKAQQVALVFPNQCVLTQIKLDGILFSIRNDMGSIVEYHSDPRALRSLKFKLLCKPKGAELHFLDSSQSEFVLCFDNATKASLCLNDIRSAQQLLMHRRLSKRAAMWFCIGCFVGSIILVAVAVAMAPIRPTSVLGTGSVLGTTSSTTSSTASPASQVPSDASELVSPSVLVTAEQWQP